MNETLGGLLRSRAGSSDAALYFEDSSWTYQEFVAECELRAGFWWSIRDAEAPPHIGVLLDNVPDYLFWLGAAALTGATVVGINSTYRGAELGQLIDHTDCQVLITEQRHVGALADLALPIGPDRIVDIDAAGYAEKLSDATPAPAVTAEPDTLLLLIFTSGSTAAPKAVRCTHGRFVRTGGHVAAIASLGGSDVVYPPLPLFHSSALFTGWSSALNAGASMVLRRRFSASGFLPDVRRYGVTFVAYTGRVLNYILATPTPTASDDSDNPLRLAIGNEASELDLETFPRRFGCEIRDSYGSTEGLIIVRRSPDMPKGALGTGGAGVKVLDPETGAETADAQFMADGRLGNEDAAVGELVQVEPGSMFEGYYNNPEADSARFRDGIYWSGDLAYRDSGGWIYFAGRDNDWLRVDGENFAARPIEHILIQYEPVRSAAVYAVPDESVGDQVMATIELVAGHSFDPVEFDTFLEAHPDLGTKWRPSFVRVTSAMPMLASLKTDKRLLRREAWACDDPVWSRAARSAPLRPLDASED